MHSLIPSIIFAFAAIPLKPNWQHVEDLAPDHALIAKGNEALDSLDEERRAEPAAKELAKLIAEETADLAAEETFRTNVAFPLCQAEWARIQWRDRLAEDKASPSGVVNLRDLYVDGQQIKLAEGEMARLKPGYAAFRRHSYAGWESEGVCAAFMRAGQSRDGL